MRSLPDNVEALLAGLDPASIQMRPSPHEWSPLETCCHLRDSAQIWGLRIQRILNEENPALEPYEQEALAREGAYQIEDLGKVLLALRAYWGGLAYQIERLSPEEWARPATHPRRGQITLIEGAEMLMQHGRDHLEQIRRAIQAQH